MSTVATAAPTTEHKNLYTNNNHPLSLKMVRMSGGGQVKTRLPFQPRHQNINNNCGSTGTSISTTKPLSSGTTTTTIGNTTDDFPLSSKGSYFNNMRSNNNQSGSNNNSNTINGGDNDYSNSSTVVNTGTASVNNSSNNNNKNTIALSAPPPLTHLGRNASGGFYASSNTNTFGNNNKPQILPRSESDQFEYQHHGSSQRSNRSNSQSSSKNVDSGSSSSGEPVIIEEQRRKINGDAGYTIHHYQRGKLIGKGGFAKVYHCTSLDTNKEYAVKIVPKSNLTKPRAKQKLQAEIKIHRTLKHQHICEYKHFFEDKNNCYILLELCHNQSMNELLKRRKRITEPESAYYMQQIVDAVQYMHDHCVIHRDLKLGNLFLDKKLNIKVGDLGLATRLENPDEKRKTICGTPNYIAPEVIQGSKETRGHSFEVDIWSMGVILYTTLVGKPPYEAKDVKATYQRIIANQYSFPSNRPMSHHAKSLITSMLQSKPYNRPSLDEIRKHPFFTSNNFKVPEYLPLHATHVPPEWLEDEYGNLYAVKRQEDENASRTISKKKSQQPSLPIPSFTSRRQPFSKKDTNTVKSRLDDNARQPSKNDKIEQPAPVVIRSSTSSLAASAGRDEPPQPTFRIFDETESSQGQRQQADSKRDDVEELITKAATLSIKSFTSSKQTVDTNHVGTLAPGGTNDVVDATTKSPRSLDGDMQALLSILSNLSDILERADSSRVCALPVQPTHFRQRVNDVGAATWVTRYVDYTSKYGLGFLLNDGSSGVYFNDSTKAVLESEGETFQYIERRKPSGTESGAIRSEPARETHSLTTYPETLQKKVTLLKHFRNYLMEQQKRAEADGSEPLETENAAGGDELVFLKKWVRTKHAIVFRLSDQTIQLVFYDQTEILLTNDERYVTYVDKKRSRSTYSFDEKLVRSHAELAKRLKYAKEILQQLAVVRR